jgi:hypothetical protein
MKNLILLAGDGDFTDMVKLMREKLHVRVFIFAWSDCIDYKISTLADTTYLDELFEKISVAKINAKQTNADRLRQEQIIIGYKKKE